MKQLKLILLTVILTTVANIAMSQTTGKPNKGMKIGDNPTKIDTSAILDVESKTKGFVLPCMTAAQRDAIVAPAKGLVIYNTTASCLQVNIGTTTAPNWKCSYSL